MDQRAVAVNMVCLFAVLFLMVSLYCFFKYMRLLSKRWNKYISQRRYEMYLFHHKRTCNKMFLAIVAVVAICWGGAELGVFF